MKNFRWRENAAVILLVLLIIAGLGYRLIVGRQAGRGGQFTLETSGNQYAEGKRTDESFQEEQFVEESKEPVIIHVVGAVRNPGVYTLQEGDRVLEAVKKAGGFLEDAYGDAVNLAARVYDGQQIYIPREGEEASLSVYQETQSQKININTASQVDLETLPGIGPAKAGAIVQDREKNGPFKSVEDLTRVTGIGEKTLEGMRDSITI
ncbi:helix-hairpin-helix domain-containing protein [Candidatus Contubernalis alkaliaceticus]|uniref:helix-hairpin-helix domain-containing protein n=1 Tax=Candidatus Contubernalis alkaliaceticus TaxID=338645 RepID=UPI001F4BE2ED|nr:helix-hairpin-helix domain-containing protein [Candidatus Contubernalis alkalaceticus]UNC93320.1 helix-hairpin-helix domain-containing protein [Candidatus Contubernalis alkalaceticus]